MTRPCAGFIRVQRNLILPLGLLLITLLSSGCASKDKTSEREQTAFQLGQRSVLMEQQQAQSAKQPHVWFRGDVKNQQVPWTNGLSLAEALLTAQYTSSLDPRTITITRQGAVYPIDPRRLLRAQENPLLEPGDIVNVHH